LSTENTHGPAGVVEQFVPSQTLMLPATVAPFRAAYVPPATAEYTSASPVGGGGVTVHAPVGGSTGTQAPATQQVGAGALE